MADRNVTTGAVYVATHGTGNRQVTAGGVYVATFGTGNRQVTTGAVYVATWQRPTAKVAVTFGPYRIAARQVSLSCTINQIEYTSFDAIGTRFIPGQPVWTITLGTANWTHTIDRVLSRYSMRSSEHYQTMQIDIGGTYGVQYRWAQSFVSEYGINLTPADAITYNVTFTCDGTPERA